MNPRRNACTLTWKRFTATACAHTPPQCAAGLGWLAVLDLASEGWGLATWGVLLLLHRLASMSTGALSRLWLPQVWCCLPWEPEVLRPAYGKGSSRSCRQRSRYSAPSWERLWLGELRSRAVWRERGVDWYAGILVLIGTGTDRGYKLLIQTEVAPLSPGSLRETGPASCKPWIISRLGGLTSQVGLGLWSMGEAASWTQLTVWTEAEPTKCALLILWQEKGLSSRARPLVWSEVKPTNKVLEIQLSKHGILLAWTDRRLTYHVHWTLWRGQMLTSRL